MWYTDGYIQFCKKELPTVLKYGTNSNIFVKIRMWYGTLLKLQLLQAPAGSEPGFCSGLLLRPISLVQRIYNGQAMVSWFLEWRIDRWAQKSSGRKKKVGQKLGKIWGLISWLLIGPERGITPWNGVEKVIPFDWKHNYFGFCYI